MQRDYDNGINSSVDYFTGKEVEKTRFYGQETLFVAKFPLNYSEIVSKTNKETTHIFIGANYTLNQFNGIDFFVVIRLLNDGYNITFDGTNEEVTWILFHINKQWKHQDKLCGIIQLRIPNVVDFPGNSLYIKICEDIPSMQEVTNKGVWVQSLDEITTDKNLTLWQEYKQDKIV